MIFHTFSEGVIPILVGSCGREYINLLFGTENWCMLVTESNWKPSSLSAGKPKRKEPQAAKKPPPPKPQKQAKTLKKAAVTQYAHQELITTLKGHTGSITGGSFSSDGKHFITAADGKLKDCLFTLRLGEGDQCVSEWLNLREGNLSMNVFCLGLLNVVCLCVS